MVERTARRSRRSATEVRRDLLIAGERLFAEHGYEATTQRLIAAEAGVSTSVLFRQFGSKSNLLVEAVIEPFGSFVAELAGDLQAARAEGQPEGRWFAAHLTRNLREHRAGLRAVLTTLQSHDGDVMMRELAARLEPLFSRVLAHAHGDGSGPETELRVRLVVGMITISVMLDEWFQPPGEQRDGDRWLEVLGTMTSRRAQAAHRFTPPVPVRPPSGDGADERGDPAEVPDRSRMRKPDEVRKALLDAAATSFVAKGFAATSYRDIARAAGTSESALFRHFRSKSNLLIEAVLEPFAAAFDSTSRRWAALDPELRRERQPEYVGDLYRTLVANRQLLRILMGVANDPDQTAVNDAVIAWFAETFAGWDAQQGAQASPPDDSYEPELRRRAALAMIVAAAALDDWFLPVDRATDPATVIRVVSGLISSARGGVS